jgi:hypothetical protein
MLTAEQNETLTRVGPETPMGKLMRNYWQVSGALGFAYLIARLVADDAARLRVSNPASAGVTQCCCPSR